MNALGREAGDGALDDHGLDLGQERTDLLGGGLVPGDQHHRHAMLQGDERVQALSPTATPFSRTSQTAAGL